MGWSRGSPMPLLASAVCILQFSGGKNSGEIEPISSPNFTCKAEFPLSSHSTLLFILWVDHEKCPANCELKIKHINHQLGRKADWKDQTNQLRPKDPWRKGRTLECSLSDLATLRNLSELMLSDVERWNYITNTSFLLLPKWYIGGLPGENYTVKRNSAQQLFYGLYS